MATAKVYGAVAIGGLVTGDEAEYLASVASSESGLDERGCDPRVMAVNYCRLVLAPWPRAAPRLSGGVLHYPSNVPEDAQAFFVAHEVGHDLIEYAGVRLEGPELERACSRIAAALLLPRRAYARDVAALGWDVRALRKLWPLASPWIHARRIAEIDRSAVASRWRPRRRVERTPCCCNVIPEQPTARERALASSALAGRVTIEDRAQSWPHDGAAIVICGLDRLR